jgi:hypothetical protein
MIKDKPAITKIVSRIAGINSICILKVALQQERLAQKPTSLFYDLAQ